MNTQTNTISRSNNLSVILLILRVGIGSMMMLGHGLPKLQMLFSDNIQFASVLGISPFLSLVLAVFSEVLCSLLLLFGLGTRLATIPLLCTMLVAAFIINAGNPFSNRELALHYILVYIALLVLGAGKFSLDTIIKNYRKQN